MSRTIKALLCAGGIFVLVICSKQGADVALSSAVLVGVLAFLVVGDSNSDENSEYNRGSGGIHYHYHQAAIHQPRRYENEIEPWDDYARLYGAPPRKLKKKKKKEKALTPVVMYDGNSPGMRDLFDRKQFWFLHAILP